MNTEIFFTLAEYKQNYDKLKNDFINAYIDNDEEEFIERQIQFYVVCLKNTVTKVQFRGDSMDKDTVPSITGVDFIHEVDLKIRNEKRVVLPEVCQNLNVSFSKIVKFLQEKLNVPKAKFKEISAIQAMLYHYVLQEVNIEPDFPPGAKEKALETLSLKYGISKSSLKKKYNVLLKSGGKEGYSEEDAIKVRNLLRDSYPTALNSFEDITKYNLF